MSWLHEVEVNTTANDDIATTARKLAGTTEKRNVRKSIPRGSTVNIDYKLAIQHAINIMVWLSHQFSSRT